MVFHLKRFEHKDEKSAVRKVTEQVRFPTALNMLPYTTIGINARKVGPA
jgi:ubiquitin carboxyl-terminal hydrolase 22/27/51